MKLCPRMVFAIISVSFLTAGVTAAQVGDEGNLAFTISNHQLDNPGAIDVDKLVVRNRLDSGATWTSTADVMLLDRSGGESFPMLERFGDNVELFNSQDFVFSMGVGQRVGIVGEDIIFGCDIEGSYFAVDNWSAARTIDSPPEGMQYLLFGGPQYYLPPGGWVSYNYISRLYNAELNLRRPIWDNLYILAGFRYLQLHEDLNSMLSNGESFMDIDFNVDNHLYGGQIGLNVAFINRPRFSIEGVVKAGMFCNFSDLTINGPYVTIGGEKSTHTAFLGEVGLMGIVQVTGNLSVRGGYQVMWLDGIGLASDQFKNADPITYKPYMGGTLLYRGAFAGLECSF